MVTKTNDISNKVFFLPILHILEIVPNVWKAKALSNFLKKIPTIVETPVP